MRYAENETQGTVNGVIFYFEDGDEEIAMAVLELAAESEKPPTSICWNAECMTAVDAANRLQADGLLAEEWLGVRLTTDDRPLARKVLNLFRDSYPALEPTVNRVASIFGIMH